MNSKLGYIQAACFGMMSMGLKMHLEIEWSHAFFIFCPLAFIFGCWLARDEKSAF